MTEKQKQTLERLKKQEAAEKREAEKAQRAFKDLCLKEFGYNPTELKTLISKWQAAEKEQTKTNYSGYGSY